MDEQQYQDLIPHFCAARTTQEHMDHLGLCWSITNGCVAKSKGRGVEGPQFCHGCTVSVRAKRWDKKWGKMVFGH